MTDRLDVYFDGWEPTDFDLELIYLLTTPTRWQRFKRRLFRRSIVEVHT